jgi:hypothetical protein
MIEASSHVACRASLAGYVPFERLGGLPCVDCGEPTDKALAEVFACVGGVCRDLQSDHANCGARGHVCCSGTLCSGGRCIIACRSGLTVCGEGCAGGDRFDLGLASAICGACMPMTLDAGRSDGADG